MKRLSQGKATKWQNEDFGFNVHTLILSLPLSTSLALLQTTAAGNEGSRESRKDPRGEKNRSDNTELPGSSHAWNRTLWT